MALLRGVGFRHMPPPEAGYPFSVPAIRSLETLDLSAPVTFFVGENGTGKSTLLEALAAAADLPALGSEERLWDDDSLAAPRELSRTLDLWWSRKTRFGFFLRAEDFFGHLRARARNAARIDREAGALELDPDEVELAQRRSPRHLDEIAAAAYLARLDNRSHGESFLDAFRRHIDGGGLYLLDEPETPLSPQRQLALLAMMGDAVREGGQFVVATHSPILLAYPGARIYGFDEPPVREVAYDELESVRLMREFLAAPGRYLRHLGV